MSEQTAAGIAAYEAEVIPGLEAFAIDELRNLSTGSPRQICQARVGFVRFRLAANESALLSLRSVIAVYRIHDFAIPRPKALLGHEHFTRLLGVLRAVAQGFGAPPQTMGIAAAGSQTAVMRRLRHETSRALGLPLAADGKGELFLRLVKQVDGAGWEALVRTSAVPISKRHYRLVDVPGALNATVAYAMTQVERRAGRQVVANLCSGSSTILIEHALTEPEDTLLAIDNCPGMIRIARQNTERAQQGQRISHLLADAQKAPLPAGSVDVLYADLPFGHHIGSHAINILLYPALLREASRLAKTDGIFVLLTHDVRLLAHSVRRSDWRIRSETRINLSGLHPRLFVLQRISARI